MTPPPKKHLGGDCLGQCKSSVWGGYENRELLQVKGNAWWRVQRYPGNLPKCLSMELHLTAALMRKMIQDIPSQVCFPVSMPLAMTTPGYIPQPPRHIIFVVTWPFMVHQTNRNIRFKRKTRRKGECVIRTGNNPSYSHGRFLQAAAPAHLSGWETVLRSGKDRKTPLLSHRITLWLAGVCKWLSEKWAVQAVS